jgi:hypothetical protein
MDLYLAKEMPKGISSVISGFQTTLYSYELGCYLFAVGFYVDCKYTQGEHLLS